ncbi:MAG: zinc ABC transporter solute-binding protein [Oscillatoria sp. SIO1A7]|nr:zinc ABC transporter solute-binding protein [Oscillatoria sp. SIO1A7]
MAAPHSPHTSPSSLSPHTSPSPPSSHSPHTGWRIAIGFLKTALLVSLLTGCAQETINNKKPEADEKLAVVSTSTILTDLTEELAGDEIALTGILEPGADPHVYEPVPADSKAFESAELIVYNGYNLEPGLIKLMNATGVNARKLAAAEVVAPLRMDYEGQKVPDPHVWGDVENAIAIVEAIRDDLVALSPEDEPVFTDNAAQLIATLKKLDIWIEQQMATIPADKRQLVTSHDAFQYYAEGYGLKIVGTLIGTSTEEQPSAQTVTKLVEDIKKTGVPAIFAETTINPTLIKTVAEEAGVKLSPQELYSDSIGSPGSEGDSYIKMMVSNTRAIVEALGGTYTPFEPDNIVEK